MTFEYLMAHYLLSLKYDKIISYLHLFNELNYSRLPRNIEEAILVYQLVYPDKWKEYPHKDKIKISRNTIEYFIKFNKILKDNKNIKKDKFRIPEEYKNSYWYYLNFTVPKSINIK